MTRVRKRHAVPAVLLAAFAIGLTFRAVVSSPVSAAGRPQIYVGSGTYGTVSVVDPQTNTMVATLSISASDLIHSPSQPRLYIASDIGVRVLNTDTNTEVARIIGLHPEGFAFNATATRLYIPSLESGTSNSTMTVVNTATSAVQAVFTIPNIQADVVAVHPDDTRLYVARRGDSKVLVMSTTGTVLNTVNSPEPISCEQHQRRTESRMHS
jgi:DNA-binding beta-propeller fold protein YncE